MQNGISISKIWSDDDLVELRIIVSDQASSFCNTAYVGRGHLAKLASQLSAFRDQIHGGIEDIRLGEFGPEYAKGALQVRMHFRSPGKLYVSTHQQSEFKEFSVGDVAAEARMYMLSEPVLLDKFIRELEGVAGGSHGVATLECT